MGSRGTVRIGQAESGGHERSQPVLAATRHPTGWDAVTWHRTLATSVVAEAEVAGFFVAGVAVAIYHVDGAFFATADLCTHGQARLSEGYLEDGRIECPLHQGLFDVRTGKALTAPCSVPVQIFPVKLEDGHVYIDV